MFTNSDAEQRIQEVVAKQKITWYFISLRTPHFDGLWEAAVKMRKNHLKRTVGNTILAAIELTTVLTQIEAIMSSKSLMAISGDPKNLEPLTSGLFDWKFNGISSRSGRTGNSG